MLYHKHTHTHTHARTNTGINLLWQGVHDQYPNNSLLNIEVI